VCVIRACVPPHSSTLSAYRFEPPALCEERMAPIIRTYWHHRAINVPQETDCGRTASQKLKPKPIQKEGGGDIERDRHEVRKDRMSGRETERRGVVRERERERK